MRRVPLILLAGLVTLASRPPSPVAAESPVEPGKVFVGDEGLAVAIVPVKPQSDGKVLIQITGSGSAFDGKVIPHKVKTFGDKTNFETTYHGRNWVTIAVRQSWADTRSYSLGLPGRRDSPTVAFDEKRTRELKAADV